MTSRDQKKLGVNRGSSLLSFHAAAVAPHLKKTHSKEGEKNVLVVTEKVGTYLPTYLPTSLGRVNPPTVKICTFFGDRTLVFIVIG